MKKISAILFLFFASAYFTLCEAQCSVCAAGAASTARTNGKYGAGINSGIIYLLIVTYLVFTVFAIYFLRHRIRYYFRTLATRWRMFIASF
ncbi:MAG TPA: hypothetical protein VK809_01815 [Bacteroidia bacterium]|jgi:hypothetical protein|nr:hypothetical protein [Bacteroidia bacterium]